MSTARAAPAREATLHPHLDADIAIVGAGAAGLAAARALAPTGLRIAVLEAGEKIGGRALTTRPAILGGGWLDEGAAWLHAPDRNPLVPLARAAGIPLADAFGDRLRLLFTDGRPATAADRAAYDDADTLWRATVEARHRAGPADTSLAEAAATLRRENPWGPTVETWEAAIIAAADAPRLGLADWACNQLPDGDLIAPDGLGTLLATLLAPPEGVAFHPHTAVTAIDRTGGARTGLALETARGSFRAAAAIVTVSTGVLRAGAIRFTPALPHATADAIARLPMGLLSKLVLPTTGDRLGQSRRDDVLLESRVPAPGTPFAVINAWPRGEDHLVGFVGGDLAWSLQPDDRAAEAFLRDNLRDMLGPTATDALLAPGFHQTAWGADERFRGAYAYAGPGDHPARAALAAPIDDGRLVFAGEACRHDGLAGTVGGAVRDGNRAARIVAETLRPGVALPHGAV